jgi:hypothetical protein
MPRRFLVSVAVAAVVVGALFLMGHALSQGRKPTIRSAAEQARAVRSVSPAPGDIDLRQVKISAELAPGYTGTLLYDGAEVPADDIQVVSALNTVTLDPQPDSQYRTLSPGQHCATVVYWPLAEGRNSAASYRWCFTLH